MSAPSLNPNYKPAYNEDVGGINWEKVSIWDKHEPELLSVYK